MNAWLSETVTAAATGFGLLPILVFVFAAVGSDLQQLAAAVGSKNSAQILSYLSHAADRHMMHRAAAGPAVGAAATGLVAQSASCTTAGGTTAATCATPGPVPAVGEYSSVCL